MWKESDLENTKLNEKIIYRLLQNPVLEIGSNLIYESNKSELYIPLKRLKLITDSNGSPNKI